MTIDHTVTIQVQVPTSTSTSSSSGSSSGSSTTTNSSSTSSSSSKSCIGLNIESKVGCGFVLTGIFFPILIDLIGVSFCICYQCYLKKWFLRKRLLKEIKNCPPVGDESEGSIVENEIGIGEQIA